MEANLKKILRSVSLELRHTLEGWHDKKTGVWNPGDLEQRLNEIGAWSDRPSKPLDEMPHLSAEDRAARRLVDGYLQLREEAGVGRSAAVAEFVRESAYTWANRLFALRCMEARGIIDEVVLQKTAYAGRSMVHQRYIRKNPDATQREDDGLFEVLFAEFQQRACELPALFNPNSPAVALRPSVAALKRCIALLSGTETVRGQEAATDEVFAAPDAFGWAYQYWNADEKDRVFEMVRTKKGAKIEGSDIIPATQLYTEPYMVKFLIQNSLGALWMGMYPDSKLWEQWEYFVKNADRAPVTRKPVREISFLDPAQGSGHFHLEACDLFYAMYEEEASREGRALTPRDIAASILNNNLFGIDIDGRSVQIAMAALWMKAKERATELEAGDLTTFHEHLVATNIRLPRGKDHLELFLQKHPEDKDLRPALELVFQGLEHADELGSLLQIEEPVDAVLRQLKEQADKNKGTAFQAGLFERTLIQTSLPVSVEDYAKWKCEALNRLQAHFEAEAQVADAVQSFFSLSAGKGLSVFNLLARRFDVVAANPPYMGSKNMGEEVKNYVETYLKAGKRDLYAAFVLQCIKMAATGGSVAMVTMNKWLHARAYSPLRCGRELSAIGIEKGERSQFNILFNNRLCALVDLGSRAFDPENQFHDGVQVALFVLEKKPPVDVSCVAIIDCTGARDPDGKDQALLQSLSEGNFNRTQQKRFVDLPGSPLCYKLSDELLGKISVATRLGLITKVRQGICTTHDPRFVRMFWEISLGRRWKVFAKGGGHKRWDGLRHFAVDWDRDGSRIKEYITDTPHAIHWSGRMPEAEYYFKGGWCFSRIAFGALGVRKFRETDLFGHTNPIILFGNEIGDDELRAAVGLLNSPLTTYLLRAITQSNDFHEGYLRRLPWPTLQPTLVPFASEVTQKALQAAANITSAVHTEVTFAFRNPQGRSLCESVLREARLKLDREFIVCAAEAVFQRLSYRQWNLSGADIDLVERNMGALEVPAYSSDLPPESSFLEKAPELVPSGTFASISIVSENLKQLAREYLDGVRDVESLVGEEETEDPEENDETSTALPMPPFGDVDGFARNASTDIATSYLALRAAIDAGSIGKVRLSNETRDYINNAVLRLLGHRWPKQIEAAEPVPAWADQDGVIPLTSGSGEMPLIERVQARLVEDFTGGNVAAVEREFEEIVGTPLEQWLAGPFFDRHISQFKKRPIAWQLETIASRPAAGAGGKGKKKRGAAGKPVFACLVYYHKLDDDLLPKIRTQYIGQLRGGFETEVRTLERLANPTVDQEARKLQLDQWIDELQTFDRLLEDVSLRGFGPDALRPALRQYGINDALLSLTSSWLRRLSETVANEPLRDWTKAAVETELHPDLPKWLQESMSNLNHFCAVLGPKAPEEQSFATDPTGKELAPLVCHQARSMVKESLRLGCDRWWRRLDAAVLEPLRQEIKDAKAEIEKIDEELDTKGLPFERRNELGERKHELKEKVKSVKLDHDNKSDRAEKVRDKIEVWTCPEAETWDTWLASQSLFDPVASLDGQRPPPHSIAEFITQESRYAPDINDGVRVNIAPIQKAGLLHANVLDAKDVDKAIADRAEWRADERRWVREGKLPQPGWWKNSLPEASA